VLRNLGITKKSIEMENKRFVIAINRECGSGGGTIAKQLGKLLGVPVFNKLALKELENKYNLTESELEEIKANKRNWWDDFCRFYRQFGSVADTSLPKQDEEVVTSEKVYKVESTILKEAAAEQSCIIVGRSGFFIFRDDPSAVKILITAKKKARIERLMRKQQLTENEAEKLVQKIDSSRETYTKTFAGCSRYDARNYDLVINVTNIPIDAVAEFLAKSIKRKFNL